MSRVKRGVKSHYRHKKILKLAKGFYGRRKNTIRIAKQAVEKSFQYSYRDRKAKKNFFRSLWIQRINAAVREYNLNYSKFIYKLKLSNITLNRKIIVDLILNQKETFQMLIKKIK